MPSISVDISTGADDGRALLINGAFYSGTYLNTSFPVGFTKLSTTVSLIAALRFQTINIPQASTINSATLNMVKAPGGTVALHAKIYGNNVDNAAPWGTANRVNNIAKTSHSTALDTVNSTSINDVTAVVQDIVNRSGWAANNALAFGIFPNATLIGARNWFGYAFEKGAPNIPNLSVTYTSGGGVNTIGFTGFNTGGITGTTGTGTVGNVSCG